jgi:N-acetylmuramate 1-kinase
MGDEALLEALRELSVSSLGHPPCRIEPMPGGASMRRFFRVHVPDPPRTAVAMVIPDAGRPEEISHANEAARRWPFLEVRDLLAARGVRVPALYAEDCARGLLLVEDLGDRTIAAFLEQRPNRREAVYQAAVRDLARAQAALENLPPGSIVGERAFDAALLAWEMHHFREWGLEARGRALRPEDRTRFDAVVETICGRIASWPRGFVHRDYQSRNLMVLDDAGDQLAWVDFQDALLGPRVYDLVALLQDSYQSFDGAFLEARLDEYARHLGLGAAARAELGQQFHTVTVQRKLKDAGRFVFIEHKKGDASYLPFVEPTLEKVRASLAHLRKDPILSELSGILERALGG